MYSWVLKLLGKLDAFVKNCVVRFGRKLPYCCLARERSQYLRYYLFITRESRHFVISVLSLMAKSDFLSDVPHYNKIVKDTSETPGDRGSCIASLDGE
jgi:hypothetical protein